MPSSSFENPSINSGQQYGYTNTMHTDITAETLKHLLENALGGKNILREYRETQDMTDRTLRKLVNTCVFFMLTRHPDKKLPPIQERIKFAEAVVDLFPNLADSKSKYKYAAFYDPDTRTGFFSNRLRHIRRTTSPLPKKRKLTSKASKTISSGEVMEEVDENRMKDAMTFLNHCSVDTTSLGEIKEKMQETYKYRKNMRENILIEFPRMVDTFGLIDQDFEAMFPGKSNKLLDTFSNSLNNIINVYERTTTNQTFNIDEDGPDFYDKTIRGFLLLVHLLPPTARGRGKAVRDTVDTCIRKLVMYKKPGVSLESVIGERETNQPFIIAVGPSKATINQYFICVHNKLIVTQNTSLSAIDILCKTHYVLNLQFQANLRAFYTFLFVYFYEIEENTFVITPTIRKLRSKLSVERAC